MLPLHTLLKMADVVDEQKRAKRYFTTATGAVCYVLDPEGSDIRLEDIAVGLSRVSRWGGHIQPMWRYPYTVAQHSVLASELVESYCRSLGMDGPELYTHALEALFHDATEAYLGDIMNPLKSELPTYKAIEKTWAHAIGRRFGLGSRLAHLSEYTKRADLTMLFAEHRVLRAEDPEGRQWCADFETYDVPYGLLASGVWSSVDASGAFLRRNRDLRKQLFLTDAP